MKVLTLYAWIVIDPKTGDEIACAFGSTEKPVGVHADSRLDVMIALEPQVKKMARGLRHKAELREFIAKS